MPSARRSTRTASSTAARASAHPFARANRQPSPKSTRPSASIARPANGKTSLRLTVKAPPSKLRQATSGSPIDAPFTSDADADAMSESDATPQPATRPMRTTRNPRTVVEPDSDSDEDEDAEGEEDEDAEAEVSQVLAMNANSEEDAEGEEDEDEEMEDDDEDEEEEDDDDEDEMIVDSHPPPPIIKQDPLSGKGKPNVTVTAPPEGPLKSVEDKEMEDDDDDEELSELDSNENEEDEEVDSDEDSEDGSRSATPDLSKLTRRQRGVYEEADANLMALSNEAQKKKHLTAEEHAMRRAEMARRRKNLSEKRNEEEKMDTINKLLSKPAPKRRTRAEIIAAQQAEAMGTPGAEYGEEERPDSVFVRWVNGRDGSRTGVPIEWLDAPVGDAFKRSGNNMVQEVT